MCVQPPDFMRKHTKNIFEAPLMQQCTWNTNIYLIYISYLLVNKNNYVYDTYNFWGSPKAFQCEQCREWMNSDRKLKLKYSKRWPIGHIQLESAACKSEISRNGVIPQEYQQIEDPELISCAWRSKIISKSSKQWESLNRQHNMYSDMLNKWVVLYS